MKISPFICGLSCRLVGFVGAQISLSGLRRLPSLPPGGLQDHNCRRCQNGTATFIISSAIYDSLSDVGEIRVYQRADFQSGSRVLRKVF